MMSGVAIVSPSEIILITPQNCSANISPLLEMFEKIAMLEVNADTTSLPPTQGAFTSLSFTITDEDLGRMLQFTPELQAGHEIKMIASNGNSETTMSDQRMKHTPGITATVFTITARVSTSIWIITTSEDEVSLLVTLADYSETLTAIGQTMREPQD